MIQYLHEDDLKNSDTGELAMLEHQKEEEIFQQNLKENEDENQRVAAIREERLKREDEERRDRIKIELQEFERSEAERIAAANKFIREQALEIDGRIKKEDIEEAILKALNSPIDYEYAIDTEGHIFRGRTTRAKDMDTKDMVKLPLAGEELVSETAEMINN